MVKRTWLKSVPATLLPKEGWWLGVLLILVGFATLPVLRFGFVLHDDGLDILLNPTFHPFDGAAIRRLWTSPDPFRIYTPLGSTVLGGLILLARCIHGLGPLDSPTPDVFHAAGVLLHIVNTWLVFRLLQRSVGTGGGAGPRWLPLLPALLFALHPAQVESYARAGNIPVTLGACLSLLALGFFLRSLTGSRWTGVWSVLAFLLFMLATLTHPSAIALPAAAFAFAWAVEPSAIRALILRLLPWLLVSVTYIVRALMWHGEALDPTMVGGRWWERLVIAADSLTWYSAQVFWPSSLTIDHGRTPQVILASPTAWLSVVGVATAPVVLILCTRNQRWMAAGGAIFLVLLLPVSGLLPAINREGLSIVYDRHLYLPLFGVSIVAGALLPGIRPDLRLLVGLPLLFLLGLLSRNYQRAWNDSVSLFRHVVKVNPASWYGNGQLGAALLLAGRPGEAVPLLARSLELNPDVIDTRIILGQALLETGRNEEAERMLREVSKLAPNEANTHNNLTVALLRRNAFEEAETEARTVLKLSPGHPMAMANLALCLAGQGKKEEALLEARRAVFAHPAFAVAWRTLSEILFETGQRQESLEALSHACELDPDRHDWRDLLATRQKAAAKTDGDLPPDSGRKQ